MFPLLFTFFIEMFGTNVSGRNIPVSRMAGGVWRIVLQRLLAWLPEDGRGEIFFYNFKNRKIDFSFVSEHWCATFWEGGGLRSACHWLGITQILKCSFIIWYRWNFVYWYVYQRMEEVSCVNVRRATHMRTEILLHILYGPSPVFLLL